MIWMLAAALADDWTLTEVPVPGGAGRAVTAAGDADVTVFSFPGTSKFQRSPLPARTYATDALANLGDTARLRSGQPDPAAPHGRRLPADLTLLDEPSLIGPGRRARIYAVADDDPPQAPLVLIHGLNGGPRDLQSVADLLIGRYDLYVACYDDFDRTLSANADDLALELVALRQNAWGDAPLTLVAHSMGGIVTRRAINRILDAPFGARTFSSVHVIAVDTPWHGFFGPSDRGLSAAMMAMTRPFLPDGLEEMRARSNLFAGEGALFDTPLPEQIRFDLVFAEAGDEAHDFTEGAVREVVDALLAPHPPEKLSEQAGNFLGALRSSTAWAPLSADLGVLRARGLLDHDAALGLLSRHYPHFPGDHTSVLGPHADRGDLLAWLDTRLRP